MASCGIFTHLSSCEDHFLCHLEDLASWVKEVTFRNSYYKWELESISGIVILEPGGLFNLFNLESLLCETVRVWESTIGLICYSTSRRLRKLSKEAVYAWDEEPITSSEQTGNCQDHPSRDAYLFLIIFMFCYVLGLNGKCIYHVTLISSDIFRSKWKRSLFVDFLHWAEQINSSAVPARGY